MRRLIAGLIGALSLATLAAQQPSAPPATRRVPQFENTHVRVWKTTIEPGQPLSMHRHERPRTLVALVGGTVDITTQGGATKTVTWETGKAYWLEADPPGELHADVNKGTRPIEVMIIEMR